MLRDIEVPIGARIEISWKEKVKVLRDHGYDKEEIQMGIFGNTQEKMIVIHCHDEDGITLRIPEITLIDEDGEDEDDNLD